MKIAGLWAVALCACVLIILGCRPRVVEIPPSEELAPKSVQIFMLHDTLWFSPCDSDSVSADGYALVTDWQDRVLPGKIVSLRYAQSLGSIFFADSLHGDTTNAEGRVAFRSRVAQPGTDTLIATCESLEARFPLNIAPESPGLFRLTVSVSPDTIRTQDATRDSVKVTACLADAYDHPLPCVSLEISAVGGRLSALPPTDSTGCASTYWTPGGFGQFCVYVQIEPVGDFACVVVIDTIGRIAP